MSVSIDAATMNRMIQELPVTIGRIHELGLTFPNKDQSISFNDLQPLCNTLKTPENQEKLIKRYERANSKIALIYGLAISIPAVILMGSWAAGGVVVGVIIGLPVSAVSVLLAIIFIKKANSDRDKEYRNYMILSRLCDKELYKTSPDEDRTVAKPLEQHYRTAVNAMALYEKESQLLRSYIRQTKDSLLPATKKYLNSQITGLNI